MPRLLVAGVVPEDGYKPGDMVVAHRTLCEFGCPHLVVASIGYGPDWSAYVGHENDDPERVRRWGDKIPREAAERVFPQIQATGRFYRD